MRLQNKKIFSHLLCLLLITTGFLLIANTCQAGIVPAPTGNCQTISGGRQVCDYTLDDFIKIAIAIANLIWGISGSLALFAFIYGGIIFLVSSGNSEKVTRAKQIIAGAALGLVIVFSSYLIIGFIFKALGIDKGWMTANWF